MLFMNCTFPLILLNKRIGKNIYIILLVTLLMNWGWLFESFVIHITSMHRDYAQSDYPNHFISIREVELLIKGFFVGVFALIIGNGIHWFRSLKRESV